MHWEKIHGWFTFNQLYDNMVKKFDDAIFVEIGTWKGKSAVYMGEKIQAAQKNIKFYTIDTFDMTESNDHFGLIDVDDLYDEAAKNINPVNDFVEIIKGNSHEIYDNFKDESIDFLFIDGSHQYEDVKKDLELWFPKMKPNGIISGHDYNHAPIKKAIDDFFNSRAMPYTGGCWYFKK